MAKLTAAQHKLCEQFGTDHGRLWVLRRALGAARAKGLANYDPIDVALLVGFRQGVKYTRKQTHEGERNAS